MGLLIDRAPGLGELELTLRRIVVGARVVGASWLLVLVIVGYLGSADMGSAVVVAGSVALVVVWAVVWVLVFRAAPDAVTTRVALATDAVAGVVALMAPSLAGTDPSAAFTGGLPLTMVAVGSVRSIAAAWVLAAVMISTTVVRAALVSGSGVVLSLSQVILYVAGAIIFTWILGVLRRADASRVAAERAAAHAEAERAREAERSQISRHLHDSVLQTLALIQRSSASPGEVTVLARRQERELRDWLFGETRSAGHLVDAVRAAAGEIEAHHAVAIDVVPVGDAEMTGRLGDLVAAGREAMANAARHAGVEQVSVYVEVDDVSVRLFIRDRGRGFDRSEVPSDRKGITESIEARVVEAGGRAEVRSGSGRGTEWKLEVPR